MREEIINQFSKHQQELVNSFKEKMKKVSEEVLSDLYTDVLYYADTDANTNYKNKLRDELTAEFREEITNEYSHYSWAHDMRMYLLKHHKEELQNKIIEDLQEKLKHKDEIIESMRERW